MNRNMRGKDQRGRLERKRKKEIDIYIYREREREKLRWAVCAHAGAEVTWTVLCQHHVWGCEKKKTTSARFAVKTVMLCECARFLTPNCFLEGHLFKLRESSAFIDSWCRAEGTVSPHAQICIKKPHPRLLVVFVDSQVWDPSVKLRWLWMSSWRVLQRQPLFSTNSPLSQTCTQCWQLPEAAMFSVIASQGQLMFGQDPVARLPEWPLFFCERCGLFHDSMMVQWPILQVGVQWSKTCVQH